MKRCALLVGVNEYKGLNPLQYARQDAESFAEMLQRCCGFEEHEITLMTCQAMGATCAFSRFVEHALTDLTERRDLDLLVFGFWGHGFSPEPGKRYLCGIDTLENDLDRTAVPLDIVRAKLAQAGARDTLLVLDCCQNRPAGRGAAAAVLERGAEGQLASMARDIQAAQSERGVERIPTVAIMSACREGQRAYEWPDKAHGVFTAHLLEGMTQGVTSVAQLASFVCERTPVTVQKLHRERQVPWFTVEGRGDFVLAAPARTGHIEVLDAPRLHIVTRPASARVSVDGKSVGQGPVAVELVAGLHTVRVELAGFGAWERRIQFDGRGDATLETELVALPPVSEPEAPDSEMPYDDEPVSDYDLDGLHLPPLADSDEESQAVQTTVGRPKACARILSEPEGAKVLFDGRLQGHTPLTLTLPTTGTWSVRIEKEGYVSASGTLTFDGTKDVEQRYVLEPKRKTVPPAGMRVIRAFVERKRGCWDHAAWLSILQAVRGQPGCEHLSETTVGDACEAERRCWKAKHQPAAGNTVSAVKPSVPRPGEDTTGSTILEVLDEFQFSGHVPPSDREVRRPGELQVLDLGKGTKLELVWIPPGKFLMGSPESEPERSASETQHQVTLTQGFWMGKYEVTQAQWQRLMGSNPSRFGDDPQLPVEQVSWEDCQEFIRRLNVLLSGGDDALRGFRDSRFRLPTEAEWEYTCRAGKKTPFHFGKKISTRQANYNGDYTYGGSQLRRTFRRIVNPDGCSSYGYGSKGIFRGKTTRVGGFPANHWGLCDMHGNVWEWCEDWYGDYSAVDIIDPVGPGSGEFRVMRGGSWNSGPQRCRSAYRSNGSPGRSDSTVGFRLLCTA